MTHEELELVDHLPDPVTGELHPATPDTVAGFWLKATDWINQLTEYKKRCVNHLVEESQLRGKKTLHLDNVTLVMTYGTTHRYDPIELMENLRSAGCPEERINEAVTEIVSYKINRAVLKQLAGANETYADAIMLASQEVDTTPSMRVK